MEQFPVLNIKWWAVVDNQTPNLRGTVCSTFSSKELADAHASYLCRFANKNKGYFVTVELTGRLPARSRACAHLALVSREG